MEPWCVLSEVLSEVDSLNDSTLNRLAYRKWIKRAVCFECEWPANEVVWVCYECRLKHLRGSRGFCIESLDRYTGDWEQRELQKSGSGFMITIEMIWRWLALCFPKNGHKYGRCAWTASLFDLVCMCTFCKHSVDYETPVEVWKPLTDLRTVSFQPSAVKDEPSNPL